MLELEDCLFIKSTDCDQRSRLATLVFHRARGPWIERGTSVYQEIVLVMAVMKREGEDPASIRHAVHRIGVRIPVIEITHHTNLLGGRREAGKVHLVEGSLR